jgi:hypothetical protein
MKGYAMPTTISLSSSITTASAANSNIIHSRDDRPCHARPIQPLIPEARPPKARDRTPVEGDRQELGHIGATGDR